MFRLLHTLDEVRLEALEIVEWCERFQVAMWKLDSAFEHLLQRFPERLSALVVGSETEGLCDLFSGARISRLDLEHWPGNLIIGFNGEEVRALLGAWNAAGLQQASTLLLSRHDSDAAKAMAQMESHRSQSRLAAGSPISGAMRPASSPMDLLGIETLRLTPLEGYRTLLGVLKRELRQLCVVDRVKLDNNQSVEVHVALGADLTLGLMENSQAGWDCLLGTSRPTSRQWMPECQLQLGIAGPLSLAEAGDRHFLVFRPPAEPSGRVPTGLSCVALEDQGGAALVVAEFGRNDLARRLAEFAASLKSSTNTLKRTSQVDELTLEGTVSQEQLEDALEQLAEGGSILLKDAEVLLSRPLAIEKALKLLGEDPEASRFKGTNQDASLTFCGGANWEFTNLAFHHCRLRFRSGDVTIRGCHFLGCGDSTPLDLRRKTRGWIQDCWFAGNDVGLSIAGRCRVHLESSLFEKNRLGIAVRESADVVLEGNECRLQHSVGILLSGLSRGRVQANHCSGNAQAGIAFRDRACGLAENNHCCENDRHGLLLWGQSTVVVRANQCERNGESGICLGQRSVGWLLDNHCEANEGRSVREGSRASAILFPLMPSWQPLLGQPGEFLRLSAWLQRLGMMLLALSSDGTLTQSQIMNLLSPEPEMTPERIDPVLEFLVEAGIEILDDSFNAEEEVEDSDDPEAPELVTLEDEELTADALLRALRQVRRNGTVRLGAGDLIVPFLIKLHKPLHLVGAGLEVSNLWYQPQVSTGTMLTFIGPGAWQLSDLWMGLDKCDLQEGAEGSPCSLVSVQAGELSVHRCCFSGADGPGLTLSGSRGDFHQLTLEWLQQGLLVEDGSTFEMECSTCSSCDVGVEVRGKSRGTIWNCEFSEQDFTGVAVSGKAEANVLSCRFHRNGIGFRYSNTSSGAVTGNAIADSSYQGIVIRDRANPKLTDNHCSNDKLCQRHQVNPELLEPHDPKVVKRLKKLGYVSPKWLDTFFNLVGEMLSELAILNSDPRLSLGLPQAGGLSVTIGRRYVIAPRNDGQVELIVPVGTSPEDWKGEYRYSFSSPEDADCIAVRLDPWDGLNSELKAIWLETVAHELKRSKSSTYRRHHQELMYDVIMNPELRKLVLLEIFEPYL